MSSTLLASMLVAAPLLLQEPPAQPAADTWVVYEGKDGLPGSGKHIVLIAGDEEYRSEEALPMLARILARHHGFKCTVLFSQSEEDGTIDPTNQTHIPGMHLLAQADMLVAFLRFRELPDADMKHFVEFIEAGKPVLGIRTSTHAFDYKRNAESPYQKYSWRNASWPGGFGKQILGETWVAHHGGHGSESTRGAINPEHRAHPILKGVTDIWGPTDVYSVKDLPEGSQVLVYGQVLSGMDPGDPPVAGAKNDPMMPLIWVREYAAGARAICSTIGASVDMQSAGLRRALVNACYWGLRLEDRIPAESVVDYVGEYAPSPFGFGKFQLGVKPADHVRSLSGG